jgi:hypothetical protein
MPDAAQRARVVRMARVGMPEHQIAFSIAVSLKTLQLFYTRELIEPAIELNLEVLETFALLAKSGKSAAATIAWANARCGFRSESKTNPGKQTEPPKRKYDSMMFRGPNGQFEEVKLS